MARKVFVSSDMAHDEKLIEIAEAIPEAALLWPWFVTYFDDWGRAEAQPKRIKAQLFPMNNLVTPELIEQSLQLYADYGLIELYEVDGKRYMAVDPDKWFKYQTHIRKEKRENDESRFPAPTREDARECAQERDEARDFTPSPSPSLSLSLSKKAAAFEKRPSELIADDSVTPQRFYEVAWGQVVGPTVDAVIEDFEDELEPSAIKWAIWEARLSDARGPSYIRRICKRLASEGLRTAEAAEQNERARRAVRNGQPRGDPKPQYYAPGQDPNKELVE